MAIRKDDLGERMKTYEVVPKTFLTLECPKVIRLDMRAGHTFCKKFDRPFDDIFSKSMIEATKSLCTKIQGTVLGYVQSDEISIVLNDITKNGNTSCFFDGNVEKIVSISASICTLEFQKAFQKIVQKSEKNKEIYEEKFWQGEFDSRVFCLPSVVELHNYLVWRQQDATRNSIQMVGHANFSDEEMHKKNTSEIQDMLMLEKGINWNNVPVKYKRGAIILREPYVKTETINGKTINVTRHKWVEKEIPILTQAPDYIKSIFNRENV